MAQYTTYTQARRTPILENLVRIAVASVTALLAACAGVLTDLNGARNSWQGMPYKDVVAQWGEPTSSTKDKSGRDTHTWVSEGQISRLVPSIGIFVGSGSGVGAEVTPQAAGPLRRCERTLVIQDSRVVEQTWQGDDNYCSTFVRH